MSNLLPKQRTTFVKKDVSQKEWILIDASNEILGRLASRIAARLRGKHRTDFAPHQDNGDIVVVINSGKIRVTGNKLDGMNYYTHTGHPSGFRITTLKRKLETEPAYAITKAVQRMLPSGPHGRKLLKNLKVYAGDKHPHKAQNPVEWKPVYK